MLTPNVCCAITCRQGKENLILLVHNTTRKWEIPGGKVDRCDLIGETDVVDVLATAERELREETGIDLPTCLLVGNLREHGIIYADGSIVLRYECTCSGCLGCSGSQEDHLVWLGITQWNHNEEEKIDQVRWFSWNRLPPLSFPNDHIFKVLNGSNDKQREPQSGQ